LANFLCRAWFVNPRKTIPDRRQEQESGTGGRSSRQEQTAGKIIGHISFDISHFSFSEAEVRAAFRITQIETIPK
jgi:hypothetical protein